MSFLPWDMLSARTGAKCGKEEFAAIKADLEHRKSSSQPNWIYCLEKNVTKYYYMPSININDIRDKSKINLLTTTGAYKIQIAPNPYKLGGSRVVYFGRFKAEGSSWQNCVLKCFIDPNYRTKLQHYKDCVENTTVTRCLCDEWNKLPRNSYGKQTTKPITVISSDIVEVDGSMLYHIEPLLPNFNKWTDNSGKIMVATASDRDLIYFAKYSYDITGGYLMVTDIQGGAGSGNQGWMLTDPAILCGITRFGFSNIADLLSHCYNRAKEFLQYNRTDAGNLFTLYNDDFTADPSVSVSSYFGTTTSVAVPSYFGTTTTSHTSTESDPYSFLPKGGPGGTPGYEHHLPQHW